MVEQLGAEVKTELDERGKPFLVVTWNGDDEGIERLSSRAAVRWLDLSRTNVTDAGARARRPDDALAGSQAATDASDRRRTCGLAPLVELRRSLAARHQDLGRRDCDICSRW